MTSFEREFYKQLEKQRAKQSAAKRNSGGKNKSVAAATRTYKASETKSDGRTWLQKSAYFDDGYQRGDVTKTILATATDASETAVSGILGIVEGGIIDATASLGALGADNRVSGGKNKRDKKNNGVGGKNKNNAISAPIASSANETGKKISDDLKEFIAKDIIDEKAIAKKIVLGYGIEDVEAKSVFGEKSRGVIQSGGQLLGTIGLQAAGVPWWLTTGATSYGGEVENALNQGATIEEAALSGAIAAGAEIVTEKISGTIGFGGKALDDAVANRIARAISNKFYRTAAKLGLDVTGEAVEEWLAADLGAFGQWLTYRNEEELMELLFSEETMDEKIEAAIGGGLLGGTMGGFNAVSSKAKGVDYASGLTANEEKVVKKEYEDRVAKEGDNLTEKQKDKIYSKVLEAMENGEISIDTIEELLGGDSYKAYRDIVDREEKAVAKLADVYKGDEQRLKEEIEALVKASERGKAKSKLSNEVFDLVKDSRLAESYYEVGRRIESFKADLSQYSEKQRGIVQKAIDSGVLNNTRRTHLLVDTLARISEDKDIDFDFATNQKLKESGFAVEGADVNGYVVGNNITINMNSRKAWEFTVGHEITHVLEGTELYGELRKAMESYAKGRKSKSGNFDNEYAERFDKALRLYKTVEEYQGVDGQEKIEKEVIADLVGDYIFNDTDFIRHLSTNHRNIFEKIYDEIKYLAKVVTAGSEEAKKLEKVKRLFEKAYRESGKKAFDVTSSVEEKGNLLALHNITSVQLMDALERNGIVMPSLAVTDDVLEEFGDYTLVFDKRTIDPYADKSNKLYGADAWTPTQTELKKNAVFDDAKVESFVETAKETIGEDVAADIFDMTAEQFKQTVKNADGNTYTAFHEDIGMQTVYAMESGLIDSVPRKNGSVDRAALKAKLDSILDKDAEYRKYKRWLKNISDTTITSFDSATNAEILESMKAQPSAAKTFKLSENGELVVPAAEYMSIAEVKRNRGRISKTAEESTDVVAKKLLTLADRIARITGNSKKSTINAINDAFKDRYDASAIADTFKQNGISIPLEVASELQNLYRETVELPTRYFEAKPHREIPFSEVVGVVVPKNIPSALRHALESRGLTVKTYDPDIDGDRSRVVNEFEEYKFSLTDSDAKYSIASELAAGESDEKYWRPKIGKQEWDLINYRKSREFDDPTFDIDEDQKWLYAKEKGVAVFAIYSKNDPDDPTVLYAAKGKNAEKKHTKLLRYMEEYNGNEPVREDLDRVFEALEGEKGQGRTRLSDDGYRRTDDGTVPIPKQESRSNGNRNSDNGRENLENDVTEQTTQASDNESGAFSMPKYSIVEYTEQEKQEHNKAALDHFGKTYSWNETGYLLRGGEKLDFSGKHEGARGGYRTVDHRQITEAFEDDYSDDSRIGGMVQFMSEGNIRIMPESNGINLSVAPTKAQERALEDYISRFRGEVIVDLDDLNGNTLESIEYPRGTRASKVLADIRNYFAESIAPQVSDVAKYRYSLSDNDYFDAIFRGDTETAQKMLDEAAKAAGYTTKAYHGTRSDEFFVFDKNRIGDNYYGYNAEGGAFDFTTDEDSAFAWGGKALGRNPVRTIPVYLKAEKTFYSYHGAVPKDLESTLPEGITEAEKEQAMSAGYAYKELLEKHGIDFKQAITSKGYDSYAMYPGHESIAVYEPEQIKSAALETTDPETGAIIPLSERFNPKNDDIRYSLSDDDIAPVGENVTTTLPDDFAPVRSDIAPTETEAAPVRIDIGADGSKGVARVLTEEPKVQKKSGVVSWLKNNVLDKGMVFEDLSLKTGNRELQARWNSIRYAEARAQRLMEKGNASTNSLKSIREAVEQTGKTQKFFEYLYHQLNVDRMTLEDRYADVENKPVFGDSYTAEMSKTEAAMLEKANPEFKQYAQEVYDYMTNLREMLVDGGVISKETADLWATMYPHYVPIRRVGDNGLNINVPLDTRRTGVNAPVKRATGGSRDILPLFDTMAQRTLQTYKAIAKNRFGVELKNTLGTTVANEAASVDEVIDSVDTHDRLLQEGKNGTSPTFTVFEDGKKVTFEITDEMYDAMKPKSGAMAYTNKALNTVINIRRGALTEYNPWFLLKNAVKDVQDVLINSQHAARTYAAIPKAIKQMATNGHWYAEYLENGGEQNTYFDNETNTFKTEKTALDIAKTVSGLNAIAKANNVIERLPRLAEYIASREAGRSIDVAMLDAARVTTNFAAGGDLTKFLNRNGATFLNASVQGAMQQARNIREAKMNGLKGWASLAGKFVAAGLPVIALNHLIWDDDEEYEELSDYVKQNYYIVGKFENGQFVRIPKGRTVAVIQNAFEQMDRIATGDDEADLKSFLDLVVTNLAPNNPIDNNILSPIVQAANNETWYGEDLVPTRLQDLPAAEQYDESTDSISRWLGETIGISPYKANYLLDQYSGVIGDTFLPMLTPEAESGDNSFLGNMIAPLRDMFITDSVMNNQNVSDFYDKKDELTANANSAHATDEDTLKSKYINSINSQMGELYGLKREIQSSSLPDDEKYAEVREIQQQIDSLAREGLNTYNNVKIDGDYATVGNLHYRKKDGAWTKITDKQYDKQDEVTRSLDISPSEYWSNKEEYDYAYEYPEKYAIAKSVGGYEAFKSYSSELYDIKADKDANGKSISGSRKKKVINYINGLDADYGEKIILLKFEYPSDDTYNYAIINYLNSRNDISYEEMTTILQELGFIVSADGKVSWD